MGFTVDLCMWIMVCVSRHCRDIPRQEYRDLERILSHTYCMINTRKTITPPLLLLSSDAPTLNSHAEFLLREPVHSFQSFSFAHTPLLILTDKGNLNITYTLIDDVMKSRSSVERLRDNAEAASASLSVISY